LLVGIEQVLVVCEVMCQVLVVCEVMCQVLVVCEVMCPGLSMSKVVSSQQLGLVNQSVFNLQI